MKKTKRIIALLLALVSLLSVFSLLSTSACAANVCSQISGNVANLREFNISTKSRFLLSDKVTLTQDKGTLLFYNGSTKKEYGYYTIKIEKLSGGKSGSDNRVIEWRGSRTKTFALQKNAEYRIRVLPYNLSWYYMKNVFNGSVKGWYTYPRWEISKTKGIDYCT